MLMLKRITYEEARLDFFKAQAQKARRSFSYWVNKAVKAKSYLDEDHCKAGEAWDRVCFYEDVVNMLEGKRKHEDVD